MRVCNLVGALIVACGIGPADPGVAWSQASPTPTAGTPDARGTAFRFAVGVDGNLALGVVDRYLIGARGDAQLTTPVWGFFVEPRWAFAKVGSVRTDSEYYLRTVGYLFPRRQFYGFGLALAERSLRRKYDHRLTGGAGLGVNLVRGPRGLLLAALGALFETTEFYTADFDGRPELTSANRQVFRAATRVSGRLRLGERGSFYVDAYFKPAVADPGDYRILAKAIFELVVARPGGVQLSARALLDYTRETVVIAGTARDELTLVFGLGARRD